MSDNQAGARFRLVPLDKSGLVYLGLNVTDGEEAAVFVLNEGVDDCDLPKEDLTFRQTIVALFAHDYYSEKNPFVEIDGKYYRVVPWTPKFDNAIVYLVDRLVEMRMKNASVASLTLQLEMPL
ncbi:MAG: hypothetical protein GTO24_21155 [candidate division Zixibacteria bacterium]|nr:hypothetical protein [candidate division Zixibacteria bacterium]